MWNYSDESSDLAGMTENKELFLSRISLEPMHWYAAEFIAEEFGDDLRSYSPIKIIAVTPKGGRIFQLDFYHANYSAGVQNKTYKLQMLERNKNFILALSLSQPIRLILIYKITCDWLNQHFKLQVRSGDDVQIWLDKNF